MSGEETQSSLFQSGGAKSPSAKTPLRKMNSAMLTAVSVQVRCRVIRNPVLAFMTTSSRSLVPSPTDSDRTALRSAMASRGEVTASDRAQSSRPSSRPE